MDFLGSDEIRSTETLVRGKVIALGAARDFHMADVTINLDGDTRFHRYYRWKNQDDEVNGSYHGYEVNEHGVLRVWAVPCRTKDSTTQQTGAAVLVRTYPPGSYHWVSGAAVPTTWEPPREHQEPPAPRQRPGLPRRPLPPRA